MEVRTGHVFRGFWVPEQEAKRWQELAQKNEQSLSAWIRHQIRKSLEED